MSLQTKTTIIVPLVRSVRGKRVILAFDLAGLYGVSTKRLNQQVRRNLERFPADFAFQLNHAEAKSLRLQFAISNSRWGGRRFLPYAFTEHGAVMAANVLNSQHAIAMSVEVVRAFVRLRRAVKSRALAASKLAELERTVNNKLDKHDKEIAELFKAVESLMDDGEPESEKKRIGFL